MFKITGLTWIVERAFAWLGRNRRRSKDYEYKVQTSETLIGITATRLRAQPLGCVIRLLAHPLSHSALIDAHLFEADLRGANLAFASLMGANLYRANLKAIAPIETASALSRLVAILQEIDALWRWRLFNGSEPAAPPDAAPGH